MEAAGVGAVRLLATVVRAGALDYPGGAGPVGASREGLPAGTGGQAVGVARAVLLREPALRRVGDLNPARAGRGRSESTSGLRWSHSASLPGDLLLPEPHPKPNLPLQTLPCQT